MQRQRQEKLRRDRLEWVLMAFGMLFYAALGTVLMVFASMR